MFFQKKTANNKKIIKFIDYFFIIIFISILTLSALSLFNYYIFSKKEPNVSLLMSKEWSLIEINENNKTNTEIIPFNIYFRRDSFSAKNSCSEIFGSYGTKGNTIWAYFYGEIRPVDNCNVDMYRIFTNIYMYKLSEDGKLIIWYAKNGVAIFD